MSVADRVRAYRARQKEAGKSDSSRKYRGEHRKLYKRMKSLEQKFFVGADGEGCGTDALGRQNYMLFRIGNRELYTGQPLSTIELLDFICDNPPGYLIVGFAFNYDVTMILRDLPPAQQKRLFEPKQYGEGKSVYVWYKNFDIDFLPRNHFRVRRVRRIRMPDGGEKREPVKGSARTIYETFGFFQCSFLKAINNFEIGTSDERERIARNKESRSSFESMDAEVRAYCAMECNFLAQLMEKLRQYCFAAGIIPRTWNGAGKLATSLHGTHKTLESKTIKSLIPAGVLEMASAAYYGGRFEITRTGAINQKVYEYDIRSAYPDAMRSLPCLEHGTWREGTGREVRAHNDVYVSQVSFKCEPVDNGYGQLGGIPIRSKEGNLFWPLRGSGVYWDCELRSAEKLGFKIRHRKAWLYERHCTCQPFAWVRELFDYRRSIGSQGPGYPIKLAINSLYGKLAQRIGNPKYANLIWAGLITALTRSKLNDAIAAAPKGDIVMLATDGIYSLSPIPLHVGDELGDFESQIFDGLFIVQPGLYWSPSKRKRKSRGLSARFFEQPGLTEQFESDFAYWQAQENSGLTPDFPTIAVKVHNFIGLKIAVARGKSETAGVWKDELRKISFDYRAKRQSHKQLNDCVVTSIKPGYNGLVSTSHKEMVATGGYKPLDDLRQSLEDQPDYVDTSPPFED
jgi:hypothetical protein